MGTMNHNAIIASTLQDKEVRRIRKFVKSLGEEMRRLFVFGKKEINNTVTVVMLPDGSKEGWSESNKGDKLRDEFIKELEKSNYSDGSCPWDFVEVGYGEYGQKVLRGNCKNCVSKSDYALSIDGRYK